MDKLLELFPQDIIEFLEANEVDRPVSGGIIYTLLNEINLPDSLKSVAITNRA